MLFQDLAPNVHFLSDAAHLLSQSAPETSAFLMRRRNELLVENDITVSDTQRQHVCTCCGHIMVPGQGDVVEIKSSKALRTRRKAQSRLKHPVQVHAQDRDGQGRGSSKVFTCSQCGRQTRIELGSPDRISRHKKRAVQNAKSGPQNDEHAPVSVSSQQPVKSSANASSKKRAKNRKAGLQALLDQKQGSGSAAGLGLSLADFMKK